MPEDFSRGYVYLVITTQLLFRNQTKTRVPAAHPIHLHGHDFVILAQSSGNYSLTESAKTFSFNNPARRDVALLPATGYLAIAFKPDNPGIWVVHCHIGKPIRPPGGFHTVLLHLLTALFMIAWHASSGLALQILERQREIAATVGDLEPTKKTCQGWDTWLAEHKATFDQDDSGI